MVMVSSSIAAEISTKTAERGAFYYGNDMIHYHGGFFMVTSTLNISI